MKRTIALTTIAFFIAATVAFIDAGCSSSSQTEHSASAEKSNKAVQYSCSMHPEVLQDKPGDCPKCGMKLVEKH